MRALQFIFFAGLLCLASCGAMTPPPSADPSLCPTGSIRTTSGECAPLCSSNTDCQSGCCATLINQSTGDTKRACQPASWCSLSCSSPANTGTCDPGLLWCGNRSCCPTHLPVTDGARCYANGNSAAQAGVTSCIQCQPSGAGGGTGSGAGGGGGSGGGGNAPAECRYDASCLSVVGWGSPDGVPGCPNGHGILPTFKNGCSGDAYCRICLAGGFDCERFYYGPGDVVGGWAAYSWCSATARQLEWQCAVEVPGSTVPLSVCLDRL